MRANLVEEVEVPLCGVVVRVVEADEMRMVRELSWGVPGFSSAEGLLLCFGSAD